MATPYVKFSRGTPLAYKNLAEKNGDTLYFITDADSSKSKLYLGSELISSEVATLSDLEDLVLSVATSGDVLVYDGDKWVNKPVVEAISIYAGCDDENPGKAGLVPAAAKGQGDYFLAGDGTWKQVTVDTPVAETQVFETVLVDGETHEEALTRIVGSTSLNKGDIGIVKVLIANDKYEYTAYVYNGQNWAAMDGNYSAENVYFTNDFTFTTKVGTVQTLTNGSATVEAKGKNVQSFLAGLFAKEENPIATKPSVTITLNSAGAKEVGSTVTPSYSVSFKKGSYTYGPDTGITATYKVTNSADDTELTTATGSFDAITVGDSTSYSVSVTAEYTEGAIPVTNLGNEIESLRIGADSITATSSGKYTGYRNSFYGTANSKEDVIDSDFIRNLSQKSSKALVNGSEFTVNVPVGAMRVVIAYPATLQEVSSIKNVNGLNAESKSAFSASTVSVEGANGYDAIDYRVYVAEYADPAIEANSYTVKI